MAKKEYNIGLDIGDTSLGWAVSEIITNDEIVVKDSGVLRWNKIGENVDKRTARSASRMSRRRKNRRKRLIKMFIDNNLLTKELANVSISEYLKNEYNFSSEQIDSLKIKNEYNLSLSKIKNEISKTMKTINDEKSEIDRLFNKLNLIVNSRIKLDENYEQDFLNSSEYIKPKLLIQQVNENYLLLKCLKTNHIDDIEQMLIMSGYLNRRGNNTYFPSLENQGIKKYLLANLHKKYKFSKEQLKMIKENELSREVLSLMQFDDNLTFEQIINENVIIDIKVNMSKNESSVKDANVFNHVIKDWIVPTQTVAETKLFIQELNIDAKPSIRNKKNYVFNFTRDELLEDIKKLSCIDENLKKEFLELFVEQKSFYEGPNQNIIFDENGLVVNKNKFTPLVFKKLGKDFISETIGWCTFEKDQKRASKQSLSFQVYKIVNAIKNSKIKFKDDNGNKAEVISSLLDLFVQYPNLKLKELFKKQEKLNKNIKSISTFGIVDTFKISWFDANHNFFSMEVVQDLIKNILNGTQKYDEIIVDDLATVFGTYYDIQAITKWLSEIKEDKNNKFYEYMQHAPESWEDLITNIYDSSTLHNNFKSWANISSKFIVTNMTQMIGESLSFVVKNNYHVSNKDFDVLIKKYDVLNDFNNLDKARNDNVFKKDESFNELKFADFVNYIEKIQVVTDNVAKYFFTHQNNVTQKLENNSKNKILPVQPLNSLSNMAVRHSVNQIRKVLWEIEQKYQFTKDSENVLHKIVIEMTTDSAKNSKDVIKNQRRNTFINLLQKKYFNLSGLTAYKFSLIMDQSNVDLYTNEAIIFNFDKNDMKNINDQVELIIKVKDDEVVNYNVYLDNLGYLNNKNFDFHTNMWQVDHILPISKSKDDSKDNKWFITSKDNQEKREDKTAYDLWISKGNKTKKSFEARVKEVIKSKGKISNLQTYDFSQFNESRFINSQLTNTSFAMNVAKEYIENYYIRNKVLPVSFKVVKEVKNSLNDTFKNRNYSLVHHAKDAQVISTITQSDIFRISNLQKNQIKHNLLNNAEELNVLKSNRFNNVYLRETGELKSILEYNSFEELNKDLRNTFMPNLFFNTSDVSIMNKYAYKLFDWQSYWNQVKTLFTANEVQELKIEQLTNAQILELIRSMLILEYVIKLKKDGFNKLKNRELTNTIKFVFDEQSEYKTTFSELCAKIFMLEDVKNAYDLIKYYKHDDLVKLTKNHIITKQIFSSNLFDLKSNIILVDKIYKVYRGKEVKFEFKSFRKDLKMLEEGKIKIEWKINKKVDRQLNKDTALETKKDKKDVVKDIKLIESALSNGKDLKSIPKLFSKVLSYLRYIKTSSGHMKKSELLFLEIYEINNIQYLLPIYPVDYNPIIKNNNRKVLLIPQTNKDSDVIWFDNYEQLKNRIKFIGRFYSKDEMKFVDNNDVKHTELLFTSFAPSLKGLKFIPKNENNYLYNINKTDKNDKKNTLFVWNSIKILKK